MKVFKFVVPLGPYVALPSTPNLAVMGCAAVVIAPDLDTARALLKKELEDAKQVPWEEVATISEHAIDRPAVVVIAQT